jgi:hypothetical protein
MRKRNLSAHVNNESRTSTHFTPKHFSRFSSRMLDSSSKVVDAAECEKYFLLVPLAYFPHFRFVIGAQSKDGSGRINCCGNCLSFLFASLMVFSGHLRVKGLFNFSAFVDCLLERVIMVKSLRCYLSSSRSASIDSSIMRLDYFTVIAWG